MRERKFGYKFSPIVSRLSHEISPVSRKVLVLYFEVAVGPWWIGNTRNKVYAKFFGPVDEVTIYEGWTVIVNNFLVYTVRYDPFSYRVDSGLSSVISDWVSSEESRKSVYYDKTMCVWMTARAKWSLVINMHCLERCCL